jgi:putative heme-binding domain-containing protein
VRAAEAVEQAFGWKPNVWRVVVHTNGVAENDGTTVSGLERRNGGIHFRMLDERLVAPVLRDGLGKIVPAATHACELKIEGLSSGDYELRVDGKLVQRASAAKWQRGVAVSDGPQFDQAEELREAILQKNDLYFDRYRPENETYLFGFRKHEQGQNAKEVPMFDPLIVKQEETIAELRRPVEHTFEVLPVDRHKLDSEDPSRIVPARSDNEGETPRQAQPANQETDSTNNPVPTFDLAPGLEISLFAETPLLAKPTQMNFDPQGRLWIASSSVYPQIEPGQIADDKILLLEDTNGDGRAEKSTVFAEGLLIPTAVIPGDGGVYVGQSTKLLFFKDTDGDGKADEERIVLSGFGTEDTHHLVHTLHWGPDGQLYFNQSIYIHSHIETPHGVEHLNSGGVWHYRTQTQKLGVFLRGFCNPWGHQFDEFGQSFVTDGAGNQGLSVGIPGATYFTYASMRRELQSISAGSYPKFCSLELVRSEQFPEDWQGNAITCDFRAHRVVRFAIEEKDSAYTAHEVADVVRSTNVTFRPIDVKLGPDGALYIADWANPIIQHGEVDFRDPRRDHEHGRIWRVTTKGRPLLPRPQLIHASNRELLDQLLSPNAYNQQQARRVLTERGRKIQSDLARWTQAQTTDKALLQALWMYESIDVVEPTLLKNVLNAADGRIRAAAVRVAGSWHERLGHPIDLLAPSIKDAHPRVRLEAARALSQIPSARSAELVLGALNKPIDPFLDYGLWLSINDLAHPWIDAVKAGRWKPEGREKQLEFALKAIEPQLAGEVLTEVMARRNIDRSGNGPWIELIGAAGDKSLLQQLYEHVLRDDLDEGAAVRALNSLGDAFHERKAKPSGSLPEIQCLFTNSSPQIREHALRLAGTWKVRDSITEMLEVAGNQSTPATVREAAFDGLREIGGSRVTRGILPLCEKDHDSAIRRKAALVLAGLDLQKAVQPAVAILLEEPDHPAQSDQSDFWRDLLKVKGAGPALAAGLPKTGLPASVAKTGLRAARAGGRSEPELVWALTRGADLEGEEQSLSPEEIQKLALKAAAEGSPARGEKLFRRKELSCTVCHAIGGVGGKVGPDLTSIGASAQMDYLIESVLYPNRKIKEGYHTIIVETKDGQEFSGTLAREEPQRLVLHDATDKEINILKYNIEKQTNGNSLMPSGLIDPLTAGERLDLFRFLSELGKAGPFDASKPTVARSWKLMPETIDLAQFGAEKVLSISFTNSDWKRARTLVDGRLLKDELAATLEQLKWRGPQALYAAARFEVAKDCSVALKLTGADHCSAWMDGKSFSISESTPAVLSAGTHTLLLKVEAKDLPDSIRLESPEVTFLSDW